jgi:hypothetical protein
MKSFSWIVWIIGAILVIGTLDTVQDPPAINPGAVLCKIVQLHDATPDRLMRRRLSLRPVQHSLPPNWIASYACDIYHPSDQAILTGQAADPSPPLSPVALEA